MDMAEQDLDDANVGAALQQMGRKTVPEHMDSDRLAQFGSARRGSTSILQRRDTDRPAGFATRE
jgi:hypothetical protein